MFDNDEHEGFFARMRGEGISCPFIFFECKNINDDPSTPETSQIASRLNPKRGKVGVIVCRAISDRKYVLQRQKDYLHDGKYIFFLEDKDVEEMLTARANGAKEGVDQPLALQFRAFKLNQ